MIAWERSQGQLRRIVWKETLVEMDEEGDYREVERLKVGALIESVYVLKTYRSSRWQVVLDRTKKSGCC